MAERVVYPFNTWQPDGPDFGESGLVRADNVVWHSGIYQPVRAEVAYGAGSFLPVLGCRGFRSLAGKNPLFVGSATTLYYFNASDAAASLAGVLAVGATHWSFTRFGDSVLAADILNPLKVSTSLGATADAITSVLKPKMKYVTTIKTHVFGAYTDDGAGGAVKPNRFWWSGANAAANWQPGSARAGFAETRSDLGAITGVVGFEDFGVLFLEGAVYRIDYVGGDNVWSLRQIGGGPDGLPVANQDSIAVYGTDVYYWSRSGPNVVTGGESVSTLGLDETRRTIADQNWSALLPPILAAGDSDRPLILWVATSTTRPRGCGPAVGTARTPGLLRAGSRL